MPEKFELKSEEFFEGIKRLEKKPSSEQLGEAKLVIKKGEFLKPGEKIKVKINDQEKEGEIVEEEGVKYIKVGDEIFVFLLSEKGMYDLSIFSQNEEIYQLKRGDWVVIDMKHGLEDVVIFFVDRKEKKVYNKGQLINPDKPQNKFEGFEVKELEEGKYRLNFYVKSKGMAENQEYYYQITYNINPKEENRIYLNFAGI